MQTYIEAEYSDGYIHSEEQLNDISPYEPTRNIFYDILNKLPEVEHGRMVRFTLFHDNMRHDIDWRDLPDNARPIRFKNMQRHASGTSWLGPAEIVTIDFGYQYTDENGNNVQEVKHI